MSMPGIKFMLTRNVALTDGLSRLVEQNVFGDLGKPSGWISVRIRPA